MALTKTNYPQTDADINQHHTKGGLEKTRRFLGKGV
jgi:hypothetical protein